MHLGHNISLQYGKKKLHITGVLAVIFRCCCFSTNEVRTRYGKFGVYRIMYAQNNRHCIHLVLVHFSKITIILPYYLHIFC